MAPADHERAHDGHAHEGGEVIGHSVATPKPAPPASRLGAPRSEVDLRYYPGVSLVGVQEGESARPLTRPTLAVVGDAGPVALLAGLFLVTAGLSQLISNTASALVLLPIAVAVASGVGVSAMPLIIAVTMSAHAAFPTPVATPVDLMVMGPGGYNFGEYWKFGLPILIWWLVVAVVVVALYRRF
jgi:Sodium:sulfate symporter transmembrane region